MLSIGMGLGVLDGGSLGMERFDLTDDKARGHGCPRPHPGEVRFALLRLNIGFVGAGHVPGLQEYGEESFVFPAR